MEQSDEHTQLIKETSSASNIQLFQNNSQQHLLQNNQQLLNQPISSRERLQENPLQGNEILNKLIRFEPGICQLKDHLKLNIICTDTRCQNYFKAMCQLCKRENIHDQIDHKISKLKDIIIQFCIDINKREEGEDNVEKNKEETFMKQVAPIFNQTIEQLKKMRSDVDQSIDHLQNIFTQSTLNIVNLKEQSLSILQQISNSNSHAELNDLLQQIQIIAVMNQGKLQFQNKQSINQSQQELQWKIANIQRKIDRFYSELDFKGYMNQNESQNEKRIHNIIAQKVSQSSTIKNLKLDQTFAQGNQIIQQQQFAQDNIWEKKQYNNGVYFGQIKKFQEGTETKYVKHGFGIFIYKDGDRYEGQFENDKREGFGIYKYRDGNMYTGEFRQGKFEGKGEYIASKDGHTYKGQFINGKFHGQGKYIFNDGTKFTGEFNNGKSVNLKTETAQPEKNNFKISKPRQTKISKQQLNNSQSNIATQNIFETPLKPQQNNLKSSQKLFDKTGISFIIKKRDGSCDNIASQKQQHKTNTLFKYKQSLQMNNISSKINKK